MLLGQIQAAKFFMSDEGPEQGWDCGCEGHKLRQLRERAKWSFPEKLRWLEEAQKLAEAITKAAEKARQSRDDEGVKGPNRTTVSDE